MSEFIRHNIGAAFIIAKLQEFLKITIKMQKFIKRHGFSRVTFLNDKKNGKKWGMERIIAKFVLKLPQNVCLSVFLSRNYVV